MFKNNMIFFTAVFIGIGSNAFSGGYPNNSSDSSSSNLSSTQQNSSNLNAVNSSNMNYSNNNYNYMYPYFYNHPTYMYSPYSIPNYYYRNYNSTERVSSTK